MASNFFDTTIGEQITLQRGFDITKNQQQPGSVPVVSSGGISSYHNESMVKGPGVVLGRKGTLGTVFYIENEFWPHDTTLWVKDFKGNNPRFVYYFFSNISEELRRMDVGAANPALNRNHVHPISVRWPTNGVQNKIAAILSSIDEKINANRHINKTLEAMAQAIFKSWFVDFDPVKAKIAAIEQGEDPLRAAMRVISGKTDDELDQIPREHHDQLATTAALFPDEMQDSELGEIPKGWEAKPLDQIASYLNGLALQKFPPESESEYLPVIKIAQLRAGNVNGADRASTKIKPEYIVEDSDVLFSWSGSLEVEVWTGGMGALNQHLFKVTSTHVPKWFYLFATKHYLPQFREIAANKATTMGHIQRKHLSDALITAPQPELMQAASKVVSPLLDEAISLRLQVRQLAQLRDTLLPKLLSGELSVAAITE